jgi:hypothetical protein
VQAVPYWVDDPSLTLSIDKSKCAALLDLNFEESRVDANLQCSQLLPRGNESVARRENGYFSTSFQFPFGGGVGGAGNSSSSGEQVLQLSPPSSLLPLPLLSSASVGVDRSGKSHPLSRTLPSLGNSQQLRSSASTATLVTTSPSTTAAYNRCSTSNYYESEANAFGEARGRRQWCANTACWWWGAEHLVADDLTTPLQKVEPKQHFANERTFLVNKSHLLDCYFCTKRVLFESDSVISPAFAI